MTHGLPIALAAVLAATAPALAEDYEAAVRDYLDENIAAWANDPTIIDAIRAQNDKHAGLTQTDIDAMDQAWRSEVGTADAPTITPVLDHPASDLLRSRVADSAGVITEIFAMDAKGLNVAASDVTSDYWQGDEEKFTETYPKGAGAVHVGEVEFDESSQTYSAQVSIPVVDASGEVVGAMTVGLDAEALF